MVTTAEQHWRKLERLYLGAPTNAYYKPAIRVGDRTAEISIEVRPDFHHAAGAVHGSVYFKLLDDAGFFAANSIVPEVFVLTSSFTVHLLRPVASGRLTAVGEVLNAGARQILCDVRLHDDDARLSTAWSMGSTRRATSSRGRSTPTDRMRSRRSSSIGFRGGPASA
ncbi:MAG TPA: PaaI family thioesterase [Thermoanaerobaculia bacterium]